MRLLSRHPRIDQLEVEHLQGYAVAGTVHLSARRDVDTVVHLAGGAKGDESSSQRGAAQRVRTTLVKPLARMLLTSVPRGLRFEPVHVQEVAARLVDLALEPPSGRVADVVGP